jgi:hypothetical protein
MKPAFVENMGLVVLNAGDQLGGLLKFRNKEVTLALVSQNDVLVDHPQLTKALTRPEVLEKFTNPYNMIEHRCAFGDGCSGDLIQVTAFDGSPAWLCWHHDNAVRNNEYDKVPSQADLLAKRVVASIAAWGNVTNLTLSVLCWWATVKKVIQYIPLEVQYAAAQRQVEPESRHTGVGWKDTNARYVTPQPIVESDPLLELREHVKAKQVIKQIDPEPPKLFMGRPKLTRFECAAYLEFVRSLPCVITGEAGCEAHHLIGHGFSGMGTKSHDLLAFPLSHLQHMSLHKDPKQWEQRHSDQRDFVLETLAKACGLGVFG